MSKRKYFFYWAVILVLAVIVLVVLLIAASGSTQALNSFPIKTLHGMDPADRQVPAQAGNLSSVHILEMKQPIPG